MTVKTNEPKKTAKVEVIKINSVDAETDEVFFYRDEPYVNEVKYVKSGTYKLGPLSEEAMKAKEEG